MARKDQLFEVTKIVKTKLRVYAECERNDKLIEVSIDRAQFEKWIEDEGRLSWESNGTDHNGDHVQKSGKMNIHQYWVEESILVYTDVYDFITDHPIVFRNQIRESSLESLISEFDKN